MYFQAKLECLEQKKQIENVKLLLKRNMDNLNKEYDFLVENRIFESNQYPLGTKQKSNTDISEILGNLILVAWIKQDEVKRNCDYSNEIRNKLLESLFYIQRHAESYLYNYELLQEEKEKAFDMIQLIFSKTEIQNEIDKIQQKNNTPSFMKVKIIADYYYIDYEGYFRDSYSDQAFFIPKESTKKELLNELATELIKQSL